MYVCDADAVSPQGRLHQVEYALEAVKQGSAVVGLRSRTHAVIVALKRAPSELAAHQRKVLKIDHHIGIGFAGLTSDARVLSHYMRQLALSSRLMYTRPLPISRLMSTLADRAQLNTMQYGKRPYGVGFLVIGVDDTGPHLYEFNPTGNCFEYHAMSLGARNQSAKTYLERHLDAFACPSRDDLILPGLRALRETLPQNKQLERAAVSVAFVGPGADADPRSPAVRDGEKFSLLEGDDLAEWFEQYVYLLTADSAPASASRPPTRAPRRPPPRTPPRTASAATRWTRTSSVARDSAARPPGGPLPTTMHVCQEHRARDRTPPAAPAQSDEKRAYADEAARRLRPRHAWRTYLLCACSALLLLWRLYSYAAAGPGARARVHGGDVRCRLRVAHARTPECHGPLTPLEQAYVQVPSAASARAALQRYTAQHHYAGEPGDRASVLRLLDEWSALLGADTRNASARVYEAGSAESRTLMESAASAPRVWADTYAVWLDEPVHASLRVVDAQGRAVWNASLAEDVLAEDPASAHGLPAFHGYSFSGNASGPLVYAGTGSPADFARLRARGVRVDGAIALVRYGGLFRGLKVRAAQEAGAVGVLIYSDPEEDGQVTEAHGYAPYPAGPARQPSSVQRGSVQALSFYPGDPSTPGRPSYRNATRAPWSEVDSLPRIPSLPLSYATAKQLLALTQGRGVRAEEVRPRFGGEIPGAEYWTGPSALRVSMSNGMRHATRDVWNVYAVIPGRIDDERIMVGNHRDAWVFGAGDPASGTAVMHELARGLGALLATGWRPQRTIVLASWDAEEYGLVGSTEFGEDYAPFLSRHVAMYHNLDMAVKGSQLEASGSPSLARLLRGVAASVPDPHVPGARLRLDRVAPLGSGSDYTVFLQHLGIPSTDVSFRRTETDPVYHYHSNYDSFTWMDKWGDPGFARHEAMARLLGLLVLRSADAPFLPIHTPDMAAQLWDAYRELRRIAPRAAAPWAQLEAALRRVQDAAAQLHRTQRELEASGEARGSLEPPRVRAVNARLQRVEQGFLDPAGLVQRPWFRHLGVAPGRWLGYGATTLPGLTESITLDDGAHAARELRRLVAALDRVAATMSRGTL